MPEASLPTPEEARTDVRRTGSSHMLIKVAVGVVLISAILIGAILGTRKNRKAIVTKAAEPRNATIAEVTSYLINNNVTSTADMQNPNSFQYIAAEWLANADDANLAVPSEDVNSRDGYDYMARYVITLIYYALNGPNWVADIGFLNWLPVCQWLGPSPTGTNGGVLCNSMGFVEALYLDMIGAEGNLPTEIGLLTSSLRILDIKMNNITGAIPEEICNLRELRSIGLSDNKMTGPIPACIGEMENLYRINLDHNGFTGEIPETFASLDLSELVIGHNALTGDPVSIFNDLRDLRILHAQNNYFEAEIDETFLVEHEQLTSLDLANNEFSCVQFPAHLFILESLITLDMSNNELAGQLPNITQTSTILNFVSLDSNNFIGTIPSTIGRLEKLKLLDLSDNKFTDVIPQEIGMMESLVYIDLSDNMFTEAAIPSSFVNLKKLEYLALRNTNRISVLPKFIDEMIELRFLDLSHNSLSGMIPESYINLKDISHLLLNSNALTGEIPGGIVSWEHLEAAFFGDNGLSGDMNFFCANDDITVSVDCKEPEVDCGCCVCCAYGEEDCAEDLIDKVDQSERVQSIKKHDLLYPDDDKPLPQV